MIYLVSYNKSLFESPNYSYLSVEESIKEIESWDVVQFDTETSGRDPHLCKVLCAQFGNRKRNIQIVVDTLSVDLLLYKRILEEKLIEKIKQETEYKETLLAMKENLNSPEYIEEIARENRKSNQEKAELENMNNENNE